MWMKRRKFFFLPCAVVGWWKIVWKIVTSEIVRLAEEIENWGSVTWRKALEFVEFEHFVWINNFTGVTKSLVRVPQKRIDLECEFVRLAEFLRAHQFVVNFSYYLQCETGLIAKLRWNLIQILQRLVISPSDCRFGLCIPIKEAIMFSLEINQRFQASSFFILANI